MEVKSKIRSFSDWDCSFTSTKSEICILVMGWKFQHSNRINMFHKHEWVAKSVHNASTVPKWFVVLPLDQQELHKGVGSAFTDVLYVCKYCGLPKTEHLDGTWSLEDLT